MGSWAGLSAAVLLATLPAFNEHALLGFAHVAVVFFLLAGLLALDHWLARPTPWIGLAMGLLLGVIPAIRTPEVLLGGGLALTLVARAWSSSEHRKGLVWPVVGALAPLLSLLAYQNAVFGSPLNSGYSYSAEGSSFGLAFFLRNWVPYLHTLMTNAGPVLVTGAAGLAVMLGMPRWRLRGVLLLSLSLPTCLAYTAYYWQYSGHTFPDSCSSSVCSGRCCVRVLDAGLGVAPVRSCVAVGTTFRDGSSGRSEPAAPHRMGYRKGCIGDLAA